MISFEVFSFFYYFVFIWGGIGTLFIAIVVIREMLQMSGKARLIDTQLTEEKEGANKLKSLVEVQKDIQT